MRRVLVLLASSATMLAVLLPEPSRAAEMGNIFYPCSVVNRSGGYDYLGNCRPAGEGSLYWVPTLLRNGVVQPPNGTNHPVHIYLRDPSVTGTVRPFPTGLVMKLGDANATSAQPNWDKRIFWQCGDTAANTHYATPPDCPNTVYKQSLDLQIRFPYCWDGIGNTSSAMTYPVHGACPFAYPVIVPQVQIHVQWAIYDGATANLKLATGTGSIYGEHGYFQNGWDTATLTNLIATCIQVGVTCHL